MTRRKPLQWHDATTNHGAGGKLPGCVKCCDLLFNPTFAEAVYSVAIEHPDASPAALARRAIDRYHHDRHQDRTTPTQEE